MKSANGCKRMVLAGGEGCRVTFCEDCAVAELEIGSLSLRLQADAFHTLASMLQQAAGRLQAMGIAAAVDQPMTRARHVH